MSGYQIGKYIAQTIYFPIFDYMYKIIYARKYNTFASYF